MIIKQNGESRAIPWRAGLLACLLFAGGIGLFCFTCKPQARVLGKLSAKLNFAQPAAAVAETLLPALPTSLLPRLSKKTTILLMGVDSNGINTDPFLGTRSDTMMLVSIDPILNKVGVISIPRDSRVHIPNHGTDKINSAHAYGGAPLSMQTVRETFGVPVDHYIEVDTGGLKKLFEILGPVEVLVEKEMHYVDHTAKLNVDLQPGLQMLSPGQAEQYVRFRHDARGDIGRIERQQWFVRQAARKFKEPQIVLKMPELVTLAYQCVRTDLPVQDVLGIAVYAKEFPQERVVTAMLPGDARWISGGSYWLPDMDAGQAMFTRILGYTPVLPALDTTANTSVSGASGSPAITDPALATAAVAGNSSGVVQSVQQISSVAQSVQGSSVAQSAPGAGVVQSKLACDMTQPPTVAIKYPRGSEQLSKAIADQLTQAGFKVKFRWQIAEVDCQHELLVQQSLRANDEATNKICQSIPEMQNFPLSLALEARPATDFTIIVSPDSQLPSICHSTLALPTIQPKALPLNVSATVIPVFPQE